MSWSGFSGDERLNLDKNTIGWTFEIAVTLIVCATMSVWLMLTRAELSSLFIQVEKKPGEVKKPSRSVCSFISLIVRRLGRS